MKTFSVFGRPTFLKAFHGWSTAFWIPFTVLAYAIGWLQSVTFVSLISMLALFLGSFSSWQATRVEVKQDEQIDNTENKVDSFSGPCKNCGHTPS